MLGFIIFISSSSKNTNFLKLLRLSVLLISSGASKRSDHSPLPTASSWYGALQARIVWPMTTFSFEKSSLAMQKSSEANLAILKASFFCRCLSKIFVSGCCRSLSPLLLCSSLSSCLCSDSCSSSWRCCCWWWCCCGWLTYFPGIAWIAPCQSSCHILTTFEPKKFTTTRPGCGCSLVIHNASIAKRDKVLWQTSTNFWATNQLTTTLPGKTPKPGKVVVFQFLSEGDVLPSVQSFDPKTPRLFQGGLTHQARHGWQPSSCSPWSVAADWKQLQAQRGLRFKAAEAEQARLMEKPQEKPENKSCHTSIEARKPR